MTAPSKRNGAEGAWLVEIRIASGLPISILTIVYSDLEIPITCTEETRKFVFACSRESIQKLLEFVPVEHAICASINNPIVFEPLKALADFEKNGTDHSAELLNSLNLLLDFFKAGQLQAPPKYKNTIRLFADALTFRDGVETPFRDSHALALRNAVQWSVGALLAHAKFID